MAEDKIPWVPAHDRDAERAVIGAAIRDNATILDIAATLRPEDFHVFAHQVIWRLVTELYLDKGAVDVVTLADKIQDSEAVTDIGGFQYLIDLSEAYAAPVNVEHHAAIIRSFALRRELHRLSEDLRVDANDRATPPEYTLEGAEKRLFAMADQGRKSQAEPVKVAVELAALRIESRKNRVTNEGVKTGWDDLDRILGFMEFGALIIVAARPAVGKTAFALNLGFNVAKRGEHVFMTSLEQPKIELGERLIAMHGSINSQLLRTGNLNDGQMHGVDNAVLAVKQLPFTIDDAPCQGVLNIAATTRRARLRDKTKLVVIDYMQLIQSDPGAANRQEQVAAISRRLKLLARELNVPVVCLAQVNRNSESRADGRLKMSDLRESGAIEQDADVVMLLQKEKPKTDKNGDEVYVAVEPIEVEVAKNRNGPTGSAVLAFVKESLRFEQFARGTF